MITLDKEPKAMSVAVAIMISNDSIVAFKELIRRGANTWDTAPPDIKEFVDILIDGAALQNYYDLPSTAPLKEVLPTTVQELSICGHCFQRGHAHRFNCPALAKK